MRQLLVIGERTFKITVPDDAKITFGPFSPPSRADNYGRTTGYNPTGTLRIYQGSKENIVACFSGVESFRELSLDYQEQVAVEEGASIWKSDAKGYMREDKHSSRKEWVDDKALLAPAKPSRKKPAA